MNLTYFLGVFEAYRARITFEKEEVVKVGIQVARQAAWSQEGPLRVQ